MTDQMPTAFRKVYTDDVTLNLVMFVYGNGTVRVKYTATTNDPDYSRLVNEFDMVLEKEAAFRLYEGCVKIFDAIAEIYNQN